MKKKVKTNYEIGKELSLKAHDYPGGKPCQKHWDKYKKKAVKYFRRAAYKGNPNAQFDLGLQYEEGGVLKDDPKRAFYWYLKAAKKDHPAACNNVGYCYNHADGVKKNPREAIKWYKKGADLGDPLAKKNLARSLRDLKSKNKKK
jgi:TPR repeat protein